MDSKTFESVVNGQIEKCNNVMFSRKRLYAPSEDRLENFKRQAALRNLTPLQSLAGNAAKHTATFYDLIERSAGGEKINIKQWQETITDEINYRLLALGLILEDPK